jgi:transcriptional regulator with XRE-family HTH domain
MTQNENASIQTLKGLIASLGQRIEAYRISRNLTQDELAELAGVSRSTLARLEAGTSGTVDSLARVMQALGLGARLLEIVPNALASPLDPSSGKGTVRRRVRHSDRKREPKPWTWGDDAP